MKYRIPEPGTTISGFADSRKKEKKINVDRPTLDFFDVTINTQIFLFGLTDYCNAVKPVLCDFPR
jgi:hypothetical protein